MGTCSKQGRGQKSMWDPDILLDKPQEQDQREDEHRGHGQKTRNERTSEKQQRLSPVSQTNAVRRRNKRPSNRPKRVGTTD